MFSVKSFPWKKKSNTLQGKKKKKNHNLFQV
jgi:hypothetical protein